MTGLAPQFQVGDAVLARFEALRDEAVHHVLDASEAAFPDIYSRFGPKGRAACGEDIGFHLDFLRPVLETNEIAPFIGYLTWLAHLLRSRGVPDRSVNRSLDDLSAFFQARLGEQSGPIVAALAAGQVALTREIPESGLDHPCPDRWAEAEPYSAAALRGNRREALALLDQALLREKSLPGVSVHVIQPAMYEVGRQWQRNNVSVAQEHLATAFSQSWMSRGMARVSPAPPNGLRALFGVLAGNHHVMGYRMVADAFELAGWTTHGMGSGAGVASVAEQIRSLHPHLVGFSGSLPQHLRGLRDTIRALRELFGKSCPKIVVGGLVFNQFPNLAGWVGADILAADAIAAIGAAAGMFTRA